MNIPEHRKAIDKLDAHIVNLLNERTKHVLGIGEIKLKAGEEIYAPHREGAVLQRICRLNPGPISNDSLRAIYREVMSSALSLEKSMTIAYLGPEATFTHQAAIRRFGSSLRYSPQKTITDVFAEVSKNRADYGVVPIENSTEGVVTHTLDMFVDSDLKIVSQIVLPVQHCLLGRYRRARIKKLFVHPQALAQCRAWVQNHLPRAEIIETSSNARSAEFAAREKDSAAVAGVLAAEKYGLPVLEYDIQDNAANATRFLVLGRQCSPPTGKDRTSVMFSIVDQVGALYRALAPFRRFRINMTKIESRPSKRKVWEYFFFVDCDGHTSDRKVAKALALLSEQCSFVKVLGSYPEFRVNNVEIISFADDRALAEAAAQQWIAEMGAADQASARYCVALSGGRIARRLFTALAGMAKARPRPLASVHFFWGDERCVPPDDPESNYGMARELLLVPLNLPEAQIHRVRGEDEPESAAAVAESELRRIASPAGTGQPMLDLIFLGMGEDGHVASLFPNEPEAAMAVNAVYRAVTASKPPPRRITLGYPAIVAAEQVWVLASGAGKVDALRESLRPGGQTPLARVLKLRQQTRIFTDISYC